MPFAPRRRQASRNRIAAPKLGKHAASSAASLTQVMQPCTGWEPDMNNIIYLVGLVVIVLAILSFLGLS